MNSSTYQQDTELALLLALAPHCSRKTFIDVGAERGVVSRALIALGFSGTLIEPFPAHHNDLHALLEGTSSKLLPLAIDATDHEGLLHIASDAEGRTLDYFHSLHHDESNPHARHTNAIKMTCRSLDSLAREGRVDSPCGILKIDTEGSDLNVLRGMGTLGAEVLMCEFVTPALYPTWTCSFPEALVEEAFSRGFEQCIAVKRFGSHELITFGPPSFFDGQWGNLVFTSSALLNEVWSPLQAMVRSRERSLEDSLATSQRELEAKEAVIQELAVARDSLVEQNNRLTEEKSRLKLKQSELAGKIDTLRERLARKA